MTLKLPEPLGSLLGGLEPKAVTNLYGAPGTGKTCLCLLASLECVKRGGRVVYIDTEGGFSLERFRQLAPVVNPALERIDISEPKSFQEQGKVIKNLGGMDADLVVLDSAVALYRLQCAEPDVETLVANRELSRHMSALSSLAREKGIPVLVTAHEYKVRDTGECEIIGGDTLKYWSKVILRLEQTGRTSERKVTIVKHRSLPEGRDAKFMLVDSGIKPSGFRIF